MNKPPRLLILGGGIAGLSAGIYGRLNGFDTTILEASEHVGGVCQSWQRHGFNVNGSLHWLLGSSEKHSFYALWKELGLTERLDIYNHANFLQYKTKNGQWISLPTDADELYHSLVKIAPEDETLIKEWAEAIKTLSAHEMQFPDPDFWSKLIAIVKMVVLDFPMLSTLFHWHDVTLGAFSSKFQNPELRELILNLWLPEMSMAFFLIQQAGAHAGAAGYPLGGSGAFTGALLENYQHLGGTLIPQCKVTDLLIEGGKCLGALNEAGEKFTADAVISAIDGHYLIHQLLQKTDFSHVLSNQFLSLKPFPGLFYFTAGFSKKVKTGPSSIIGESLGFQNTVLVGGIAYHRANFQIYNFDPGLSPTHSTLVTAMFHTSFEFWNQLNKGSKKLYQLSKEKANARILEEFLLHYPELDGHLVFCESATPVTYETSTGNYQGSYEGWLPNPTGVKTTIPPTIHGLSHFFLAGHWTTPGGGMPPAALSGRNAVGLACHALGMKFLHRAEDFEKD